MGKWNGCDLENINQTWLRVRIVDDKNSFSSNRSKEHPSIRKG